MVLVRCLKRNIVNMLSSDPAFEGEKYLGKLETDVITGKNVFLDKSAFDYVFSSENNDAEENQILKQIVNCLASTHYDEILKLSLWEELLKGCQGECGSEASDALIETIKQYLSKSDNDSYKRQLILLFLGVACLQKFVTCNWIGPCHAKVSDPGFVNELFSNTSCKMAVTSKLSMSGDPIYTNVENPHFLLLSKTIFSSLEESNCITRHWWMMRCLIIHQQILPERNVMLHKKITDLVQKIRTLDWIEQERNVSAKIQLLIESGLAHLYYHEVVPAKQYFTEARNIVGLNVELSGAMGKRTQFQQKALAQLFVKLKRNPALSLEGAADADTSFFPCDLYLQDDVLLKHVKFLDSEETVIEDLYSEEQAVLLSHCCLIQKSGASHDLLEEELMAYVDCLLSKPKVWCIHMKALIMRSKLEKKKSRRVERAMMQLQALVDAVNKENPPFSTRQYMFYSTLFPPKWMLEKELADILISLGAVKSALEIYQRLQLWEDIVSCYQRLEMSEQAAVLVREQIKLNETPALWCLLGDVMNDPKCYLKAWEISGQKNARSQRSLGFYYYYQKKDYKSCILHFQNSLDINYLQPTVWFALGFAASQVENYELAAQAYRHVVTLDSDNFEAWNNLSNSYIKLKQKVRAWRSLQEALKCNYENWRVWENFLLVCVDIGAFEDAIQAYHRLIDIKGKHEDDEILEIVAKAISEDLLDFTERPSSRLKGKALTLFGRVTSKVTSNANIWKSYALLHSSDPCCFSDKEQTERVLNYLQKAHRSVIQQPQWEKNFLSCKIVITSAEKLSDVYLTYLNLSDKTSNLQTKSSAKLMLQNVISRAERQLRDFDDEQAGELLPLIENLHARLEQIVSF